MALTWFTHPRVRRILGVVGLASALFGGGAAAWADAAWVSASSEPVADEPGLPVPGVQAEERWVDVEWKDASFDRANPGASLGEWDSVQVSPPRTVPPRAAVAAVSFGNPFGFGTHRIPPQAKVVSARLWVRVQQVSGTFSMGVHSLPATDFSWSESQATFSQRSETESWSEGDLGASWSGERGRFDAPTRLGWWEMPIDLTAFLEAVRLGATGGLVFVADGPASAASRSVQWSSVNSWVPAWWPRLRVEWEMPQPAPDLGGLASSYYSHRETLALRLRVDHAEWLRIEGNDCVRGEDGAFDVRLHLGEQWVEAGNASASTRRMLRLLHQPVQLSTTLKEPAIQTLRWAGLNGWTYSVEAQVGDEFAWQTFLKVGGRDGPMEAYVPCFGRFQLYRLKAEPVVE